MGPVLVTRGEPARRERSVALAEPPAVHWHPRDASDHVVMFYDADEFLLDSLVGFIAPALSAGQRTAVIATEAHRAGTEARLAALGIDVEAARLDGLYRAADARETLGRFMEDGWPHAARFEEVVDGLVDGATAERPARIFGEMVGLLVSDGLPEAAVALESLWNQARKTRSFALLCGYPVTARVGRGMAGFVEDVCQAHSSVVPAESYTSLLTREEQLRKIVALQQKAAQLEHALAAERQARDAAEAALRVRDEFLSTAAHELRTPITILSVQAQLTLRRWERTGALEAERAVQTLRTMGAQADKLARLVNQLLDVSRLRSGKLTLEPHPTDLTALTQQVVALFGDVCERHPISVDAPEHLEWVVDPLRLEQVLINLFDNAIKYSPDGAPIEVRLRAAAPDTIELSVRDFGPGIEPDKRAHIFDRFFQANQSSGNSGLGLGLYLSRNIARLHGGELSAEFPPDGGTRFIIRLPRLPG